MPVLYRNISIPLCLAMTACVNTPSYTEAQSEPLCSALDSLIQSANDDSSHKEITVFTEQPMEIACRMETDQISRNYCDTVVRTVSTEFTHGYPWQLNQCLTQKDFSPELEIIDEYTGYQNSKKIVQLNADIQNGATLKLKFVSSDTQNNGGKFDNYYGRYILSITPR